MPIDQVDCEKVIRKLISAKAEFADLFFEERTGTTIVYENRKADRIRQGIDRGVGLRIISSGATLYAYSTEVTPAAIDELVSTLIQADPAQSESTGLVFRAVQSDQQSVIQVDPADVDLNTKMMLLAEADEAARSFGNEIDQVRVTFSDECRRVVQVNSEGARLEFYRAGVVFTVHVTARRGDLVQTGYEPVGGQVGLEFFRDEIAGRDSICCCVPRFDDARSARGPFGSDACGIAQRRGWNNGSRGGGPRAGGGFHRPEYERVCAVPWKEGGRGCGLRGR